MVSEFYVCVFQVTEPVSDLRPGPRAGCHWRHHPRWQKPSGSKSGLEILPRKVGCPECTVRTSVLVGPCGGFVHVKPVLQKQNHCKLITNWNTTCLSLTVSAQLWWSVVHEFKTHQWSHRIPEHRQRTQWGKYTITYTHFY